MFKTFTNSFADSRYTRINGEDHMLPMKTPAVLARHFVDDLMRTFLSKSKL